MLNKHNAIAAVILAVVVNEGLLQGCCPKINVESQTGLSLDDIRSLGPSPTYDDVIRLIGPVLHNVPWVYCPAREGGVYVFCFMPTNEVLVPKWPSTKSYLVAVVRGEPGDGFWRMQGYYVFPKRVYGQRYTGYPD